MFFGMMEHMARETGRVVQTENDISELIRNDPWRMKVLHAAEQLDLPDWWIGAGFLRNIIWDALEGNPPEPPRDVDLVYFDAQDLAPETDWAYDEQMRASLPNTEWEIRNQARMHYVNKFPPFHSTKDGISHWVETATCVGVKLEKERLEYIFCYGTDDLIGLIARPIPDFRSPGRLPEFYKRVEDKKWRERWPHLRVEVE